MARKAPHTGDTAVQFMGGTPPEKKTNRGWDPTPTVEQLKAKPNKWARLGPFDNQHQANHRRRKLINTDPKHLEAVVRSEGTELYVWAQYTNGS